MFFYVSSAETGLAAVDNSVSKRKQINIIKHKEQALAARKHGSLASGTFFAINQKYRSPSEVNVILQF